MTTAAAPQAQVRSKNSELERALAQRSSVTKVAVKEDPFAAIKANPVYQVMYSAEIKAEEKPDMLAKLLAAPQTEAEARETMKNFEQLKEFLAAHREELAVAMIKVQQSETQVELQRSLKDLNQGMLDFENRLKPVTDVIDAIYKLSLTDKAYDAFKEIKRDQAIIAEAKKIKDDLETKIKYAAEMVDALEREKVINQNNKSWFGNIKSDSQKRIAEIDQQLANIQIQLSEYRNKLMETSAAIPASELGDDLQESKSVIAKFLDLGDGEVQAQQEELFSTALAFIKANKDRVGNMRGLLDTDEKSITKMVDASEMLGLMYATMADGCNLTSDHLKERRAQLLPKEGEVLGAVEKQIRAKKLKDLDAYIERFEKEKGNTLQTVGKVTELQEKLGNLKRSNAEGVELTRIMHTDAIAEVAEGLTTTLTSLSTAAVGQSANIAKANMKRMNALTNEIAQKDSIRSAMGEEQRVKEAADTVESLKNWTDVILTRKDILSGTFGRLKETVSELRNVTDQARQARDEAASVAANIATEDGSAVAVSKEAGSLLNLTPDSK